MSRSFRSPRTRTRIHKVKRQQAIDKMHAEEIEETCTNCVFVTQGTRCPECGEISAPNYSLDAVRTAERLYGTAYGQGHYNEGLGERTYGKSDFRRKLEAKGLRVREPGEARDSSESKHRRSQKQREAIAHAVAETTRHFEL